MHRDSEVMEGDREGIKNAPGRNWDRRKCSVVGAPNIDIILVTVCSPCSHYAEVSSSRTLNPQIVPDAVHWRVGADVNGFDLTL